MSTLPARLSTALADELTNDGAVVWANCRSEGVHLSPAKANAIAERVAETFRADGVMRHLTRVTQGKAA